MELLISLFKKKLKKQVNDCENPENFPYPKEADSCARQMPYY